MTEAELVQYFDYFLQNYQIQTQIMRRDPKLYVMLNRPADVEMDYPFLTEAIVEQLRSLPLDGVQTVILNSRILGQTAPDWKASVSLRDEVSAPVTPAATPEVTQQQSSTASHPEGSEPRSRQSSQRRSSHPPRSPSKSSASPTPAESSRTPTPSATPASDPAASSPPSKPFPSSPGSDTAEPAGLDLSSYCFVRNQLLIKTSLPDPAPEVAEAVQFFHHLSEEKKAEVAPLLVNFFKRPDTYDLEGLPEDQREWLNRVQALNEQKLKSVAVWLSRYCADAEKALTQINGTLKIVSPQRSGAASAPSGTLEGSAGATAAPATSSGTQGSSRAAGLPPRTAGLPPRTETPPGVGTASSGTAHAPSGSTGGSQRPSQSRSKPEKSGWQRLALPLVGVCLVIAMVLSGVWVASSSGSAYCHQPAESTGPDQDRYDLCILTSQILGESEMVRASRSAARLPEDRLEEIPNLCSERASSSSEFSFFWGDITNENYRVAEVMPGLYTTDLQQTFSGGSREFQRYGCVFRGTSAGTVAFVDGDRLPENWPRARYTPSQDSLLTADGEGIDTFGMGPVALFSLGTIGVVLIVVWLVISLIITSGSFYIISRLGLGINVYSLPDLVLGSLVFIIWSGVLRSIPFLGLWWIGIIADVFALLLTSWIVKGFRVDYTVGYHMLLLCVLLLYGIQLLVLYILFLVFGGLIMSMLL